MIWAKAVLTLLGVVGALIAWMREREAVDAALDKAIQKQLREMDDEIQRAAVARDLVLADIDAHPERLREPDAFERRS